MDIVRLSNLDIDEINEKTVKKIGDIEELKEKMDIFIRLFPEIESLDLLNKSVYNMRMTNLHRQVLSGVRASAKADGFIASGAVKDQQQKYITMYARDAADMRFIANAIRDKGLSEKEASKFLMVRVRKSDKEGGINEATIDEYMEATGLGEYLDKEKVVIVSDMDMSLSRAITLVKEKFGQDISNEQIAVGAIETESLIVDQGEEDILKAAKAPVYLEMQANGTASQMFYTIVEIVANDGTIPRALGEIIVKKGYTNWYLYIPDMTRVDYNQLQKEIERYNEILIRA